jgi:hypothetical protein
VADPVFEWRGIGLDGSGATLVDLDRVVAIEVMKDETKRPSDLRAGEIGRVGAEGPYTEEYSVDLRLTLEAGGSLTVRARSRGTPGHQPAKRQWDELRARWERIIMDKQRYRYGSR